MKKEKIILFLTSFLFFIPTIVQAEEKIWELADVGNEELSKWGTYRDEYFMDKNIKMGLSEFLNGKEDFKKTNVKFKDIKESDWFYKDVVYANRMGFVKGKNSEETFVPQDKLTRAEVAAVLSRSWSFKAAIYYEEDIPKDLDKNHWAFNPIIVMQSQKVITGYQDKTIKPNQNVTRAEFISMLDRAIGKDSELKEEKEKAPELNFEDVNKTDWYYDSLKSVSYFMGVSGYEDGTFRPNEYITRAEMSALISRYIDIDMEVTMKYQNQ